MASTDSLHVQRRTGAPRRRTDHRRGLTAAPWSAGPAGPRNADVSHADSASVDDRCSCGYDVHFGYETARDITVA